MAKSMTGYGRAQKILGGRKFTVEMKSVNNRYLDVNIRMPRIFNPLEAKLREELKNYITRGKVDVFITYEDLEGAAVTVTYNKALAAQYVRHLQQIAADFGLTASITPQQVASFPDVLTTEDADIPAETYWEPLKETLEAAADQFLAARVREGNFITQDLLKKLDHMQDEVKTLTERAPLILEAYQNQLREKVSQLLEDAAIDQNRIVQETAIYSDKVCIDEELVRLQSHIAQTKAELGKEEAVGRKLDFLAQEMNREANTILSKTDDNESAGIAITLKTEIEKVREQIQNIE